ncbi:glucose-methanol-choline oxidoreductase-like protein [Xylariaceae sp. FL1019]|nr:glucose-methanol-choline oxidoreductase-like protein [Xylariaceae sp. FL1019]
MTTETFDFIIVGGGTAGLVLASRLSEIVEFSVLVLEAGEDRSDDPRVITPALFPTLMGSDADWNTVTAPQTALQGRTIAIPHGRVLGGSSAINGQAFVASSKACIDAWGNLGNAGWSWEALAPYFKKCHSLTVPKDDALSAHLSLKYIDADASGKSGPIRASFPDAIDNPLPKAWVETLESLGHTATGDPFSGQFVGAFTNAATIDPDTRQRSFAASAYLKPVRSRSGLRVITGAHVTRVLFQKVQSSVTAARVEYVQNGATKTAHARKEVILCAGALQSPKILELSGIGDSDLLSALSIPLVVANRFVGENLQDHPMCGLSFEVEDDVETIDDLLRQDPAAMKTCIEQYAESKSGPLAAGGIFSYALLGLKRSGIELDIPEDGFQDTHPIKEAQRKYFHRLLEDAGESTAGFFTYAAQGNFGSSSGSSLMQSGFLPGKYYSVAVCLLQPLSRGCVHIRSADPFDPARVDPRYLIHPTDLEVFARHMTYISTIVATAPLSNLLKANGRRNASAPKDISDLQSMKEYVKKNTLSSWHPTSTCAMLPLDKGGVVDERLVVHGTCNLRVVDASVFPLTTRGNPMATVYAVAEMAADLIKQDWRTKDEGD